MTSPAQKIAILTANGVNQNDISLVQRALIKARSFPKVIGAGNKLITTWDNDQWGHNFAVDISITEALGVDYDVLIVPGGERAMDLLGETAHTKRILNSFMMAKKPIVVMGDAKSLFKTLDISVDSQNIFLIDDVTETVVTDSINWFSKFEMVDMDLLVA